MVVTVNYRLGPWGELSLDSGRISGNQGLRDQVQGDKGPLTRYQVQGLWDNVQGLRDQLHKMHFFFFFNLSLRFLPCSGFRRTLFIWEATLRRLLFGGRVLEHGGLFYLVFFIYHYSCHYYWHCHHHHPHNYRCHCDFDLQVCLPPPVGPSVKWFVPSWTRQQWHHDIRTS